MLSAVRPDLLRQNYLDGFDRRNLVPATKWSRRTARWLAQEFLPPCGSTVVVLGEEVREALGLSKRLIHPHLDPELHVTYRQLPHPSGRCLWYNEPAHRLLAGLLLSELYDAGSEA